MSDLLGQETVVFATASRALDAPSSGLRYAEQHTGHPLLTPDEVRHVPAHTQLLFVTGLRPVVARKLSYYADREFDGSWAAPVAQRNDANAHA